MFKFPSFNRNSILGSILLIKSFNCLCIVEQVVLNNLAIYLNRNQFSWLELSPRNSCQSLNTATIIRNVILIWDLIPISFIFPYSVSFITCVSFLFILFIYVPHSVGSSTLRIPQRYFGCYCSKQISPYFDSIFYVYMD